MLKSIASSVFLLSIAFAKPALSATKYEEFETATKNLGFSITHKQIYHSLSFGSLLTREPFVFAEASKVLSKEGDTQVIQVFTYTRTEEVPDIRLTVYHYWLSCKSNALRFVSDTNYQDVIKNQTTGYDALGNKLPLEHKAFDEGELASIGSALPIYFLDNKKKSVMGESTNLDYADFKALSEFTARHCKDR